MSECGCLSWHHPAFRDVGRLLGKLGCKQGALVAFSVFSALREDVVLRRLGDIKRKVALLADGFGEKPQTIALAIAGLQQLRLVDDAGAVVELDEGRDEMVTKLLRHFVTSPRRGRPTLGQEAMTGAQRTARWRRQSGPAAGALSPAPSDEMRDDNPSLAALSLFPDQQEGKEEQKQPRAAAPELDHGFAALRAIWPLANRMAEAEREYRRVLRQVDGATVLALARRYLDTKEPWRNAMFLVNWLRTEPWRDPVLPLASPPRVVTTTAAPPPEPRPTGWVERFNELKETGVWRPEWGPAWGEEGCQVPAGTGIAHSIGSWYVRQQRRRLVGG